MTQGLELVVDTKSILGEGPCWDAEEQLLYWIDGLGKKIHIFNPNKYTNQTIDTEEAVGYIVLRESGGAVAHGLYSFDPSTAQFTHLVDPESHLPNNRFNDGKCDCAGRLWPARCRKTTMKAREIRHRPVRCIALIQT